MKTYDGDLDGRPEEAGYDPDNLKRLDDFFASLIDKEKLQCASYLLSRHGKVFAHRSLGRLRPEKDSGPFLPDSIRGIASITKIFTACAIMKLVEDGKLNLYQKVSSLIEEFDTDQHREINLVHLLTHTSGLVMPDPGCQLEPYPRRFLPDGEIRTQKDLKKWLEYCISGPVLRTPGTEWIYSSAGFMILGEIISRVSGMSYSEYVRKNIFEPLEMERSFFTVPENLHDDVCITDPNDLIEAEEAPFSAAGGIYSDCLDLWKFGQMILNEGTYNGKRILGPHTVKKMTSNRLEDIKFSCWGFESDNYLYGLGFNIENFGLQGPDSFGHEGAGRSKLHIDKKEKFIAVFFVPTEIDWVPESIWAPVSIIWSGIK